MDLLGQGFPGILDKCNAALPTNFKCLGSRQKPFLFPRRACYNLKAGRKFPEFTDITNACAVPGRQPVSCQKFSVKTKKNKIFFQGSFVRAFGCMVCSEDGKFISSPLKGFNIRIKAKCMRVKNILAPDFENLNCDPLSEVFYQPPTKDKKIVGP